MNSHLVSVAVFDNAQVRHAFNPKPAKLVFEQRATLHLPAMPGRSAACGQPYSGSPSPAEG